MEDNNNEKYRNQCMASISFYYVMKISGACVVGISSWNSTLKVVDIDGNKQIISMNRVGNVAVTDDELLIMYYPGNTKEYKDMYIVGLN